MRFERLYQPSLFFGVEVSLDGFRATVAVNASLAVRCLPLLEIENRSANGNGFASKGEIRKSNRSAGLQHRNRAVGRSKINAEKHLLAVARDHPLIISSTL